MSLIETLQTTISRYTDARHVGVNVGDNLFAVKLARSC